MHYLDSNVFIFARYDRGIMGENARKILRLIEENKASAITSALTLDEVIFILQKLIGYRESINYAETIFKIFNLKIVPVSSEDVLQSLELMKIGLKPRDAIHASVALSHGIFTIVSEDKDFKKLKNLDCISLSEFLKKF